MERALPVSRLQQSLKFEMRSVSKMGLYLRGGRVIMSVVDGKHPMDAAEKGAGYDCILIDDDDLVRFTWRLAAERAGKQLLALADDTKLWPHISQLPRTIPIYIDCNLTGGRSGELIVEQLSAAGFSKLYLETGRDAESVKASTRRLLAGIVGKTPPWR